jgi:hypothetical protein
MKNSRLVLGFLSLLILAGAGSGRLAAQPTPTGPETRVDTLPGDQYPKCPLIGVAPDQSFEIAWGYNGDFPPEIKARHYNASGSPTDPAEVLVAALDYYLGPGGRFARPWPLCENSGPMPNEELRKRSAACR